ncbi:MAG: hypothetical protein Q8M92_07180, partial [Candidatus Subteraquimicrobiales bacterium]|nr:hypothetical protein [Candidatus Subteraquimicrobiales bacterium]
PYWDFLESPDIHLAMKGIQAVAPKSRVSVETLLQCDYERITPNGEHFLSSDQDYLIGGAFKQSNRKFRSGNFSICLHENAHFGSNIELEVKPQENYKLTVWKYPYHAEGLVVFSAPLEKEFYVVAQKTIQVDEQGWGKMELEVKTPDFINGKYKIYIWNPRNDSVYFDDFSIEKLIIR